MHYGRSCCSPVPLTTGDCFFRLEVVGGFKDITCALVQEENNVEYLVATTSIITGESFIESLATKLEAPTF